jgi:hypothetical protein
MCLRSFLLRCSSSCQSLFQRMAPIDPRNPCQNPGDFGRKRLREDETTLQVLTRLKVCGGVPMDTVPLQEELSAPIQSRRRFKSVYSRPDEVG